MVLDDKKEKLFIRNGAMINCQGKYDDILTLVWLTFYACGIMETNLHGCFWMKFFLQFSEKAETGLEIDPEKLLVLNILC